MSNGDPFQNSIYKQTPHTSEWNKQAELITDCCCMSHILEAEEGGGYVNWSFVHMELLQANSWSWTS